MIERSSGVLLHLTSLPGPLGCGRIGSEAVAFAHLAKRCGFSYWQVLPFGPPAAGDSPYQCFSAFAGNPHLIDLRELVDLKLLSPDELQMISSRNDQHASYFASFSQINEQLLRKAFSRLSSKQKDEIHIWSAKERQACWLPDYALFMAIRRHFQNLPWWQWPDDKMRQHNNTSIEQFYKKWPSEVDYYLFEQFYFDRQWQRVKQEINQAGLAIVGDMPIYVAHDSADIWAHHDLFRLNDELMPEAVAGVPPDYFSEDGQLWGNPLYDWSAHEQTGFDWWLNRLDNAFHHYDQVRLDHFRGFVEYWSVPASARSAKEGAWEKGPAEKLFDVVFSTFPNAAIIAEDLGEIDDQVRDFLEKTKLPGMKVMQFGFDQIVGNTHMPCYYPPNCVAYTGTHDNNTLLGWLWESKPGDREQALRYAGIDESGFDWGRGGVSAPAIRSLIRCLWASAANMVIVPLQDLLGYGSDTRMNRPGLATGQWRFRVTSDALSQIDTDWLSLINHVYQRLPAEKYKQLRNPVDKIAKTS